VVRVSRPEIPSFAGAPRWTIDHADARLRTTDRMISRLPAIARRVSTRALAEPPASRLRHWLLTRTTLAGWAALDDGDLDYLARIYSPDVELTVLIDLFDLSGTHRGWPAMERFFTGGLFALGMETKIREVIDLGGPFFAVAVSQTVTGRTSGIPSQVESVNLYEIGGGVCVRQWMVTDEAEGERVLAQRLGADGFSGEGGIRTLGGP
jgi:hypothetical protein